MTHDSVVAEALQALAGARHPCIEAVERVAEKPGLYAFCGDGRALSDLRLSPPPTTSLCTSARWRRT